MAEECEDSPRLTSPQEVAEVLRDRQSIIEMGGRTTRSVAGGVE